MLNRVEEELPSAPDVVKADEIELQEIIENATKSTEDLITQFEGQGTLPMRELLGLDKQFRSIKGFTKGGGSKKGSVGRKHQERASQDQGILRVSWSL